MQLTLKRFCLHKNFTVGELYINGQRMCYTLEDAVREVKGKPVHLWKVAGKTAIPYGTYKVVVDFSNRFQKDMPHILDVPGFAGVRIHAGNSSGDTEGCILLGMGWPGNDWLNLSRAAIDIFNNKLNYAISQGEEVTLAIE